MPGTAAQSAPCPAPLGRNDALNPTDIAIRKIDPPIGTSGATSPTSIEQELSFARFSISPDELARAIARPSPSFAVVPYVRAFGPWL